MGLFSLLRKKPKPDLPPLKFYNTLSGSVEDFAPLKGHTVKMYNCGPTVYDRQHLGNMYAVVFTNTLRRILEAWGYKVNQVINITDFGHLSGDNEGDPDAGQDKMTMGLEREGLKPTLANMKKLADKYTELYLEDIAKLEVPVDDINFPRASEYIDTQIALIKSLEQKGYAYKTDDGMYFDTSKFEGYGKLGKVNLAGQEEGARVEINEEKKNQRDFALWKFDKKIGWKSPWGKGFPGWHIECTAMIFELLGKQIDIHTGGVEHIPIHHNNEIAQAEAASGKSPFVKYWLHNAHITIEGKKISKSLGNTVYLHNIIDRGFNPLAFRYWALTGHYKTPMNFTWEAIEAAEQALKRLARAYIQAPEVGKTHEFLDQFYAALANDLGTAQALALVWKHLNELDKDALRQVDNVLGLGFTEEQQTAKLKVLKGSDIPEHIQNMLDERELARKQKDFERADELRTKVEAEGFELKDTSEGPKITQK